MSIDSERIMQIREEYGVQRRRVRELAAAKDWPAAIAEATDAFEYLEEQQQGLGFLFEAAVDLATAYSSSRDWVSAEALFEQCCEIREAVCGRMSRETATAMMMLGVAKYSLSKYADAEQWIRSCLKVREQLLGDSHPEVAIALMNLAAIYDKIRRGAEATKLRERAERIGLPSWMKH